MTILNTLNISLKRLLLLIFVFWIIFAVSIYIEDYIAILIGKPDIDPADKFQYALRWGIWALYTPVIIYLAGRFRITREHFLKNILLHICFFLVFICIEFCIEVPLTRFIAYERYHAVHTLNEYFIPFILKFNFYFLLYFLFIGIVSLFIANQQYQQKQLETSLLKSKLTQAQLQTLKMQLQPHFLFNTHHAIISLMVQNENENAIKMLSRLSDLLRLTLDKWDLQLITLKEELEYIHLYLEIQQVRFKNRLTVNMDVPDELMQLNVPTFMLQPLVENAIKHGIEHYSGTGTITVSAEKKQNRLIISVNNNGKELRLIKEGVGLSNVRHRLSQQYGSNFSFELYENTQGTFAIITIPVGDQYGEKK